MNTIRPAFRAFSSNDPQFFPSFHLPQFNHRRRRNTALRHNADLNANSEIMTRTKEINGQFFDPHAAPDAIRTARAGWPSSESYSRIPASARLAAAACMLPRG
ncbi:hypothetical protein [Breoghania sp.]|uniref:hypothetical protein n=2 Tax=Breoghania sp. TaxID=2065378 RepID=UPI002AAB9707|nr:hypothetical protein [Breoghania sp.]